MDVHLRSAIHPLLGRLRIGAPRLWPLSPKLHTSDCSFACPGSSTWVDKVPSRDTPSLNLADRRGGVDPGNPQVARTRSRISGSTCARPGSPTASSTPTRRSLRLPARLGAGSSPNPTPSPQSAHCNGPPPVNDDARWYYARLTCPTLAPSKGRVSRSGAPGRDGTRNAG